MRDGQIVNGVLEMSCGGIQYLSRCSLKLGGYADPPTLTANTIFGFTQPTEILYYKIKEKQSNEKRPIGDKKFTKRRITLLPDSKFDFLNCFSRQGGNNGA